MVACEEGRRREKCKKLHWEGKAREKWLERISGSRSRELPLSFFKAGRARTSYQDEGRVRRKGEVPDTCDDTQEKLWRR